MSRPTPDSWPKSALCLLSKPSKPPKAREKLRPIALLHPVSKCLAKLAARRCRPFVTALACRILSFRILDNVQLRIPLSVPVRTVQLFVA